ncbi:hypothetical protein O0L34_g3722 [Tuta absoluta]|nr:hypothetical protein O0L34_g3722 [Tuta absoluta]
MVDELKKLKSVLRSLVVSSPTKMTLTNLLRDYRAMMGQPIPITKFGYRDPLQFLKDQCGDCFLFHGSGTNTVLTPIVPECLKHIDEFVHKQKVSAKDKYKGKRMSINESAVRPSPNLISQTFEAKCKMSTGPPAEIRERCKQPPAPAHTPTLQRNPLPPEFDTKPPERKVTSTPNVVKKINVEPPKPVDNNINRFKSRSNLREENKENKHQDQSLPTKEAYKNFMKSRIPVYESTADLSNDSRSYRDSESGSYSSESGLRTLSSTSSSTKATQLEELKAELLQIIRDSPNGVCTTEIMKMYRERYNRELNFSRFGFSSVSALACSLPGVFTSRDVAGNTRVALAPPDTSASNARRQVARPRALRTAALLASKTGDDDDALPWIDFDPDVFPEDCMSFSESIPSASLEDVAEGAMLEVMVGEVYSPSHFWLYRLGERHNIAMEDMMDHMTSYYNSGEGAQRSLAGGAVRVGHYCSSVYEQDWHRSLIVSILDSDTVKVRHVDYGTVDRVCVRRLKPLLREWGELPAQAVRARLAGVCPAARGRRWPHAAAAAFLRLVQDRRLVAEVAHVDRQENILELFLVDTSTERDIRIDLELIKSGHADACPTTDAHSVSATTATDHAMQAVLQHRGDSSGSEDGIDVRTVLSTILTMQDDISEISASASEVVGREPRRLPDWEPSHAHTYVSASSKRLSRLKALKAKLERDDTMSEVSVSTVSPDVDEASVVSGTSVTSTVLAKKLMLMKKTLSPPLRPLIPSSLQVLPSGMVTASISLVPAPPGSVSPPPGSDTSPSSDVSVATSVLKRKLALAAAGKRIQFP